MQYVKSKDSLCALTFATNVSHIHVVRRISCVCWLLQQTCNPYMKYNGYVVCTGFCQENVCNFAEECIHDSSAYVIYKQS